ncbi:MAG: hypothetical protein ABSE40_24020 [Candidatus Sulfotelmatobacter sp.]|jgi:hypothetical protein
MRIHFEWMVASILLLGSGHTVQAQSSAENAASKPLISTSVTGFIKASGLDDPQYVLSFVPVQRLMLEATRRPLTREEIQKAIQETPVTLDRLLQLELLRTNDKDTYRLNYLLLTVEDRRTIYRVSARYGQSLADAFRAHRAEFDEIVSRYPNAALRPQLMFDLIAGAALNWGGLDLTTELGYRVQEPRHATGGVYLVHSDELGAQLDSTGLYLDSETGPGSKMSFSTFGDGLSSPRLQGLPDVFDGLDSAIEDWRKLPDVYGALRSEYLQLLLLAIDDAGQAMNAVANGTDTDATLAKTLPLPEGRRIAILRLLTAIGYLRDTDHGYVVGVPALTERDKPLVDATLKLSRDIMTDWLRQNYAPVKNELSELSPMRNGLPFSLVFSEVWHYEFGFAAKSLAESGFYANPRAPGNRYEGYVPLVWASSLLKSD